MLLRGFRLRRFLRQPFFFASDLQNRLLKPALLLRLEAHPDRISQRWDLYRLLLQQQHQRPLPVLHQKPERLREHRLLLKALHRQLPCHHRQTF